MAERSEQADQTELLDVRELACARLFDEVPCLVSVQDRELRIIDANQKFRDEFGGRVGDYCYVVYKGRSEPCPECPVLLTFADGKSHTSEQTVFDKRGLPHDMMVNTRTLKDRNGRIVAVMEVFTDITVKKELLNRLNDSLTRFNTLFDQVPCFISVQDREFNIIEANEQFKENFSGKLGGHCYEIYKRRDTRCETCPVAQTFEDGQVHCSEEVVFDDRGNWINVIVYTSPLRDSRGDVVQVMEVSTDITVVRQLQDRLVNLGQLVAGIAHSIKNVLEGLRGGVYIVNRGFRDDNQEGVKTGWEMVERNVTRVSNMIMDMLYCAKDRTPRRLPVAMTELAAEVVELFRERAGDSGVELVLGGSDGVGQILADPKDIHALLANLVTNAIDACCSDEDPGKKHRVALDMKQEDGHVIISVSDNGIGMDPETQSKLFNLFFSTKGTFGTGLGLIVAHKVATEHGGTISVESKPGTGSTFTVRLPIQEGNG
ncbi:MAG TPA: ATP-binding protein [bacterium]|nr:ATP-binding protein [bacterium]